MHAITRSHRIISTHRLRERTSSRKALSRLRARALCWWIMICCAALNIVIYFKIRPLLIFISSFFHKCGLRCTAARISQKSISSLDAITKLVSAETNTMRAHINFYSRRDIMWDARLLSCGTVFVCGKALEFFCFTKFIAFILFLARAWLNWKKKGLKEMSYL